MLLMACACALPAQSAVAAPYGPGKGKVWHSGIGGYGPGAVNAFARQSGKHPAVYQYFVSWKSARRDTNFIAGLVEKTAADRARPMFAVSTSGTRLTPASIARGEGDGFLLAMNRTLAATGRPAYLRLLSEMNNGGNDYAAYDLRGRSRGRAFSTGQFKRAWRRAVLIVRGGSVSSIDARLRPCACRSCAPAHRIWPGRRWRSSGCP